MKSGKTKLLDEKIKKVLEIKFKNIGKNSLPKFQIENSFKECLEKVDETVESLQKEAKNELENTNIEDITIEKIDNLKKINNLFNIFHKFIKATHKNIDEITFAIPTTLAMFGILPMFSGNPRMLSKSISKLLGKNNDQITNEEQNEIDEYVKEVFKIDEKIDYSEGKEVITELGQILICDNLIVQAKADAPKNFIDEREGLITYIKRAYGVEGLRHLLAILIGLEENGRKSTFKLSLNKHLERLGYEKEQSGSYNIETKKMAAEIIYILSSLYVTIIKKKGKKITIEGLKFFNLEGYKLDINRSELMNSEFTLSTTEWYNNAFLGSNNEFPKYTKMLKIIAHENHLQHSLTIYLTTILSVFWRMNNEFKMQVQNLMEWCNIETHNSKNRPRDLKKIEDELNYMKEKNYIGNWELKNTKTTLIKSKNPLEEVLIIYKPDWLMEKLEKIVKTKEIFKKIENKELMRVEQFLEIFEKSNFKIKEFCEKIDISTRMFHLIKNNERKISSKIFENIQKVFY